MKIGAQRLVDALERGLQARLFDPVSSLPIVTISGIVAGDLLVLMRVAAKQDARQPDGFAPPTAFEGYMVVAWLRHEAAAYKALSAAQPRGPERAMGTAIGETCKALADDLESALERGGGTPIDPSMPRRWRLVDPQRSPGAGRPAGAPLYGVYYPGTDLCVSDMGARGTGKPPGVEWIDPEPGT